MITTFPFSPSELQAQFDASLNQESFVVRDRAAFWLDGAAEHRQLTILAPTGDPLLASFRGERQAFRDGYTLQRCPIDQHNGRALRSTFPSLQPRPLGLTTSAGFGDRLGLATPGHVHALRRVLREAAGGAESSGDGTARAADFEGDMPEHGKIAPIFAQQSIREMGRTRRTPDDVLNDATWGAFQAGWRGPVGADADHLKTPKDIDVCAAAGFTFYTFDPGDHVDSEVDTAAPQVVERKLQALPWRTLESSADDLARRYVGQRVDLDDRTLKLERADVLRAAAKYGGAVAHVVTMYRHLAGKGIPYEVEVSVDETETPTSHAEHCYIAGELKRLGVTWVSLAPRYVGRFEKGVDYIGDLAALRADLDGHAALARALGPYKLSLHSGSDKFSVYPLINAAARGQVHLKTAGTSYLEALRVVARLDPALFREILAFARERYDEDRASYHVSAEVRRVPAPEDLRDEQLPALLEDFDAREALHVTFGSSLARFESRLKATLKAHEEAYDAALERHFYRHLTPFL
jgi:hypothetical protein